MLQDTVKRAVAVLMGAMLCLPVAFSKDKPKRGPEESGDSDPGKGINFYSLEREIALGKQMSHEVELEARVVYDAAITEYVNRLGQNLVRNSAAKVPFVIKVLDSDEVNAFALPGGFMFVNTGLILKADNEAELAGVMAHEIAHVAARHGTRQATRGELINYSSIPLVFLGGWVGYAVRQAAAIAVPMGFLKFSRGMEMEADHLGLEITYRSGYDPLAFVDFFEKLQAMQRAHPDTIAKVFSTHPMTGDRIRHAQREIQTEFKPLPDYVLDTSEFHGVRDRLTRIQLRRKGQEQNEYLPVLKRRSQGRSPSSPATP